MTLAGYRIWSRRLFFPLDRGQTYKQKREREWEREREKEREKERETEKERERDGESKVSHGIMSVCVHQSREKEKGVSIFCVSIQM